MHASLQTLLAHTGDGEGLARVEEGDEGLGSLAYSSAPRSSSRHSPQSNDPNGMLASKVGAAGPVTGCVRVDAGSPGRLEANEANETGVVASLVGIKDGGAGGESQRAEGEVKGTGGEQYLLSAGPSPPIISNVSCSACVRHAQRIICWSDV